MYSRILLTTDFSLLSLSTQQTAVMFAKRFRSTIHLLHVDENFESGLHSPEDMVHFVSEIEAKRDTLMASVENELREQGVEVVLERRRGVASQEILEYAKAIRADLIIMATHGSHGVRKLLLGSTTLRVLRRSPVPVLTLNQDSEHAPTNDIQSVLFPTDLSDLSNACLPTAARIAQEFSAVLDVLHVMKLPTFIPSIPGEAPIVVPPKLQSGREAQYKHRLQQLCGSLGTSKIRAHVEVAASAPEAIAEFATRHDSHLVVIPSRGHGALYNIVFGSTTEGVVRLCPRPVLTIGPPTTEP
ncbi:MAG: universal stress protein [Myxococcales bacterium]|nr:universal stress protein [Myxococcales bacterium]